MKSGRCPTCNNQTLSKSTSGIGYGKRGSFYAFTSAINMPTLVEDYVCATCGYNVSTIVDTHGDKNGNSWNS